MPLIGNAQQLYTDSNAASIENESDSVNGWTGKGLQLGDMNRLLLEKIEELTLYILDQQQQMDRLQSELESLK